MSDASQRQKVHQSIPFTFYFTSAILHGELHNGLVRMQCFRKLSLLSESSTCQLQLLIVYRWGISFQRRISYSHSPFGHIAVSVLYLEVRHVSLPHLIEQCDMIAQLIVFYSFSFSLSAMTAVGCAVV